MNKVFCFLRKHWMSIPLCLAILYLCFMDTQSLPKVGVTNFDKFVHTVMFLTVSLVIFFENTRYFKKVVSIAKMGYFSFLFPLVYGGLIEIGQEYLSPTRSGDWMDFLFDGIGSFIGLVACFVINKKLS